ncbi:MAG: tetratricopeptide repeat-containing protein [Burkholderiales bacterium]
MNERAFVIRGFNTKKDSAGQAVDFERVHAELIAPALKRCGLAGSTTGEIVDAGNIRADMFALILEADIVVCDITVHNANVFYELGVRHALRKKHTLLIKGEPSADTTPFDLSTDRYLKYPVAQPADALEALVEALQASLLSNRETDSPIFLMMPALPEADPSGVTAVPLNFVEEVERAGKSSDKGCLRVIAEDLAGLRFQWDGLRRVARAQWKLKDFAGARASWERLREVAGADIEANLALANIYERLYRDNRNEALLESSNQAIRRVLDVEPLAIEQRAEALALQGRNLKTLWRARFADLTEPAATRPAALDIRALQSYSSYRNAFYCDLNAFYPGVAALQMGHILLLLADLPNWRNLFKGDKKEAGRARDDLKTELPALAHVVQASVTRAREQLPESERVWADIADADLLFLTLPESELQADPSALVLAYRDAVPANDPFAWDATSGQLQLFAQLGLRVHAAQAVMNDFDAPKNPKDDKPLRRHLVVFTGHGVDLPGAPPRFPASAEGKARALIAERLKALQSSAGADENLTVLASAAPGADILVHELCDELQLPSRLCLPLPPEVVAQRVFGQADHWRARFLAIVQARQAGLLQLSVENDLPRWLQGRAGIDPWERGNRWVMQMAQASDAQRVTVLALWDGQDDGRNGGTAQMVRMARAQGLFELEVMDSRQLLA